VTYPLFDHPDILALLDQVAITTVLSHKRDCDMWAAVGADVRLPDPVGRVKVQTFQQWAAEAPRTGGAKAAWGYVDQLTDQVCGSVRIVIPDGPLSAEELAYIFSVIAVRVTPRDVPAGCFNAPFVVATEGSVKKLVAPAAALSRDASKSQGGPCEAIYPRGFITSGF
jgi:hypothetical protein